MKQLLIIAVVGLAVANDDKIESWVQSWQSGPAAVVPLQPVTEPTAYLAEAKQLVPLLAANQSKAAAFVGYFGALADEVRGSQFIASTEDINQLQQRSATRLTQTLKLPAGTTGQRVADVIDGMMRKALGERPEPISDPKRAAAAEAFLAIEWAMRQAAGGSL